MGQCAKFRLSIILPTQERCFLNKDMLILVQIYAHNNLKWRISQFLQKVSPSFFSLMIYMLYWDYELNFSFISPFFNSWGAFHWNSLLRKCSRNKKSAIFKNGGFLIFYKSYRWGFFFWQSTYKMELVCQISTLYHFFPRTAFFFVQRLD